MYRDCVAMLGVTRTCGEIDDRSGEIFHMDDDVYDAA
ncbi:hypothetical protein Tco_0420323, partial [Tanacetum coccineum]